MKLRILPLAVVSVAAFALGIFGADLAGAWNTESTKEPAKFSEGQFAGQANPADIRGSYAFRDIEAAFGTPLAALGGAFGVRESGEALAAYQVKNLEALYAEAGLAFEVGTDSVRWFVALYAGLPMVPGEGTGMPATALPLLEARGADPAGLALARERSVSPPAAGAAAAPAEGAAKEPAPASPATAAAPKAATAAGSAPAPAASAPLPATETHTPSPAGSGTGTGTGTESSTDRLIKGKTTFGEIEAWGVPRSSIAEVLGMEPGPSNAVVRDWLSTKSLEFSTFKEKLQALVDAAK